MSSQLLNTTRQFIGSYVEGDEIIAQFHVTGIRRMTGRPGGQVVSERLPNTDEGRAKLEQYRAAAASA